MRKRIRVSLPKLIKDILTQDLLYFGLKMEKLCNLIVQEMGYGDTLRIHDKITDEKKLTIHFNLTERNTMFFKDMLNESEEVIEAEYFRRLLSTYANLHPSIRERVIKSYLFKELLYSIKQKRQIKIAINKDIYDLVPLELTRDEKTGYNLLKAKNNNGIYFYKIKEIELLKVL